MALKISQIIGHRGCAAYAPENTLEGIHTAADMGVEWVELDVKLTKDQVPIIFHDDTLERVADISGTIAQMTYDELKDIDVGFYFGESFIDVRIPTLEQAVDVLIERDLGLNLEIKPCPGREKETAEVALDALSSIWDDHDRLIISSFQHVSMEVSMDMALDWHRGLLLPEEWPENWSELAQYLQVSTIHVNASTVTRDQVEAAMELEKPILAYTVNEPDRARFLQSWGVDGFFTDAPDVLQEGILSVH